MSETELAIMRETQRLLDERIKMLDDEMANFAGLSAPARAIETEAWFRKQIATALQPLIARVAALEQRPAPTPTTVKPPKEFISAVGQLLHERDQRIAALEGTIANWKFCGTWSPGQYEPGNHVNYDGSTFVCLWATQDKPGTVNAWQLVAKRGKNGKDGKDGKDSDNVHRMPTQPRAAHGG